MAILDTAGLAPNPSFLKDFEERFPDKGDNLIIGCQSGRRSAAAAAALTQVGQWLWFSACIDKRSSNMMASWCA
jgi:rhodanese-related sulfurtransferase